MNLLSLISAFVVRSVNAEPALGSDIDTATTILPWQTCGITFCFNSSEAKCSIAFTGPTQLSNIGNATAEDCANLTVSLFSDYTKRVTLQNIFNDGGFSNVGVSQEIIDKLNSK